MFKRKQDDTTFIYHPALDEKGHLIIKDTKEYTNPEDAFGYDGYVTPAGTFYRVRESYYYGDNVTHEAWARYFIYFDDQLMQEIRDTGYYLNHADQFLREVKHFIPFVNTDLLKLGEAKAGYVKMMEEYRNKGYDSKQLAFYLAVCEVNMRKIDSEDKNVK